MSLSSPPYAVLGAGSWGTALALQLARAGNETLLWSHSDDHYQAMRQSRCNAKYLPGIAFPETLQPARDLAATVAQARDILVVVPSHVFRETVQKLKPFLTERHRLAWGTKGLEQGTRKLLHQIVREELGITVPVAAVSGPTFALEVAQGLPGAITVASKTPQFAEDLAYALHSEYFLTYTSDDIAGVEIGGATKNVMAIAAGIADGMGFGTNTRAALITRGLNEIMRLGVTMGGQRETFMGLSGLGDLVLTCSDDQSRNRRFGLALGKGMDVEAARKSIKQVVEGIGTAKTVYLLSQDYNINMPITEQVYKVIYEGRSPREALQILTNRAPHPEH
ncbi:MAG: NAD(P)H-dependent glycerol-3-phosphate dehydrogenase [Gammaproteobacteria bacterium]|nr:NAD(P)H-dependent glycerol-3-phosphate dehydrogenase [Gammaproteobacteria bacterium]